MSDLKGKRVLITGATGFIGANLARHFLKKGSRVHIFTRKQSDRWRLKGVLNDVRDYRTDLLDAEGTLKSVLAIRPQVILHTAVYGGYPHQNEADSIFKLNVLGGLNLINACRKTDFELFVNTGSSSEYGIKSRPMKETDIAAPSSYYGASKSAMTFLCKEISLKEGLPITTLCLFSPYGYYEDKARLIPSVILSCLKGKPPKLSSPLPVRDFVFIEDILEAYEKAVKNPGCVKSEVINIASGRQASVAETADTILKIAGSKKAVKWGAVKNTRVEPKRWQADITKAENTIGWKPGHSLAEGLEKTFEWFRQNSGLYR